jgi:hypothetical protein
MVRSYVVPFAYHGTHPVFSQPSGQAKMWRYLTLPKLVSMLDTRSLHFARADQMNDPFEGSWTKTRVAVVHVDAEGKPVIPQPPQEKLLAEAYGHETPELRAVAWMTRRQCAALSCWYVSDHESAAMWRLYAAEGIAIQTTFAGFLGSLQKGVPGDGSSPIQVGLVRYVDYEAAVMPPSNTFWPFIHKRLSFEHERELRAVIYQHGPKMIDHGSFHHRESGVPPEGFLVPIDLNGLIRAVRIAPSSPGWFADAVKAVIRAFGNGFSVEQSQLDATPFR